MHSANLYSLPSSLQAVVTDGTLAVRSPGRINLIGEHTDYNNGFVLPAAIDKAVYVTIEKRSDQYVSLYSIDFKESLEVHLSALKPLPGHWATYILGVINEFQQKGFEVPGFTMSVCGDVPLGAGLSSSAALECAVAFAINERCGYGLSQIELVQIAQLAEHHFAGVKCGIMDQFASIFGKKDQVIKLDCRSVDYEYFPLVLNGYTIVLVDSQVKHSLASTEYNVRRAQCEEGVSIIQQRYPEIKSLRDVSIGMINECLQHLPIIYNRCKYVVEENDRVQTGCDDLKKGLLENFGQKMFASHAGLSNEYEVSCPELDFLVNAVLNDSAVAGARMMGGGFGGCTINIVKTSAIEKFIETISKSYADQLQRECKTYIVKIEDGSVLIG